MSWFLLTSSFNFVTLRKMFLMDYLYHRVPYNMKGDILYPLNSLKESMPDVYEKEVKKYAGREALLGVRIPIVDCLWNDVLHLTAVHPSEVKKALIDAGRPADLQMRYYSIDPSMLDLEKAVVYRYLQESLTDIGREDNFQSLELSMVACLSVMPEVTKEYYREMNVQGKKPLLYHKIPHVLYRGTVEVSQLQIITV